VKSLLRRRPSPALVISMIALFVSLSGVSYGVVTGFIDSREIKNNEIRSIDLRNNQVRTKDLRNNEVRGIDIRNSTIQSRDIGLNQVTGEDVREDTLQKVPSALLADTATSATSAQNATTAASVGGIAMRKFTYSAEAGSGFVEVFTFGGLKLEARCLAGAVLEVRANPDAASSEISSDFPGFSQDDPDFNPGDNTVVFGNPPAMDGTGLIAFAAPDGRIVIVQALTRQDANGVRGTSNDCGFFGVAQAG
jgi:hypothetical protein